MIKLTDEQKKFILERFPEKEAFLETAKVDDVLELVSDDLTMNGFDENDDITDEGLRIEKIYDGIFSGNQ